MPLIETRGRCPGHHRRLAVHRGLHAVRGHLPARLAGHQPGHEQGLHARGRVLVLRTVRGPLPDRRGHRQHALPAAMSGGTPMKDGRNWASRGPIPSRLSARSWPVTSPWSAAARPARWPRSPPPSMARRVLLLDKAHVRHSGALAMGMDGVNNAVIPGKATPEDYVAEITRANDGIDQPAHGLPDGHPRLRHGAPAGAVRGEVREGRGGRVHVRRVHRCGSYVLPMPEGRDIKKVLYRVLRQRSMRERIRVENRVMPVRVITDGGRAAGVAGFNSRTGEFVTVRAGAVILATGACGRLGLPASGYLYGTYENPTNAGDGHAMAYHAGAELCGLECFQINPLIKDYNGPACAYVANPFGGYQVNNRGERFVDCDYWSGPDDGRGGQGDRLGARPDLPQADPPAGRDAVRAGGDPAHHRTPDPAARSTPGAGTTTGPTTWRCTSPRSGCAAGIPPRVCGWTSTPGPPCLACTRRATWPACRTTT